MIPIDLHGLTVPEAKRKVEALINECRVEGYIKECEFITGTGKIKGAIQKLLTDYEIEYFDTWGNEGSFTASVE